MFIVWRKINMAQFVSSRKDPKAEMARRKAAQQLAKQQAEQQEDIKEGSIIGAAGMPVGAGIGALIGALVGGIPTGGAGAGGLIGGVGGGAGAAIKYATAEEVDPALVAQAAGATVRGTQQLAEQAPSLIEKFDTPGTVPPMGAPGTGGKPSLYGTPGGAAAELALTPEMATLMATKGLFGTGS
jgi:hypothetical protein